MRQISKAEFLDLYEQGYLSEYVNAGDRVLAKNVDGQGGTEQGFEIVWASTT